MEDWRVIVRERLFRVEMVEEVSRKFATTGLANIDVKELLVLIADHFNDEVADLSGEVAGLTTGMSDLRTDVTSLRKSLRRVGWAVVSGLIAVAASITANVIFR